MSNDCIEVKGESAKPLPRDFSRFKKLHPNGRAVILEDATDTFGFISTVELVGAQAEVANANSK